MVRLVMALVVKIVSFLMLAQRPRVIISFIATFDRADVRPDV
jgi:hypothetical protein